MYFSQTLSAGQPVELIDAGDFLRIVASPTEDVSLRFYWQGQEVANVVDVGAGYFEQTRFDKVTINSTAGGLVRIVTRQGATVGYDRAVGSVSIGGIVDTEPASVAFTQTQATVTNASAQLRPALATRRHLLIQNKDSTGIVYVNLTGAAATVANGIAIQPGGSYETGPIAPTAAITAIGSIASNANVVVVEA